MTESIGTYMHGVNEMGRIALQVEILLIISLIFQLAILGTILYLVYRSWR